MSAQPNCGTAAVFDWKDETFHRLADQPRISIFVCLPDPVLERFLYRFAASVSAIDFAATELVPDVPP